MSEKIYSFSRLESFHNCQQGYYLTYIKGLRSDDNNIYGFCGGVVHELLEKLQTKQITNQQAVDKFKECIDDCDMFGYEFATQKSGERYVEDVIHYLENYTPLDIEKFSIEEEFLVEINGIKIKGFIDLYYYDEDGFIHVLDYKTSTKFATKDLPKKARQMVLYGYALELLGKGNVKSVGWDMVKYVEKPYRKSVTLKERCELSDLDDYPRAIVLRDYNEESVKDLLKYISDTVKEIEEKDEKNPYEWKAIENFRSSFFCQNLCEHYKNKQCMYHTY